MFIPGDIRHWLLRATITELEHVKALEMDQEPMRRSMMLVMAIDEELIKRSLQEKTSNAFTYEARDWRPWQEGLAD